MTLGWRVHEIRMILGNVAALSEPAVPKFVPRRFDVEGSLQFPVRFHRAAPWRHASDRHKLLHEPFASRFALQAGARVIHRQDQLTAGTNLCLQIVP